MKPVTALAKVFSELAVSGDAVETTAAGILHQVKVAKIVSEDSFVGLITAAYALNKWHVAQGKPKAGSDRRAVPSTVRTYVWEVRAALRAGLPVAEYATFYDLRMARKALKGPASVTPPTNGDGNGHAIELPADVAQDMQGVRLAGETGVLTGALIHDLAVTYIGLPTEPRLMFGRQLTRLMHTYQRKAAAVPLALPAASKRKAASGQ